jgi:hypothetical protein
MVMVTDAEDADTSPEFDLKEESSEILSPSVAQQAV